MGIRADHSLTITALARASAGIPPEDHFQPLDIDSHADHLAAYHGIFTVHENARDLVLAVWRFEPVKPYNYRKLMSRVRLNRFDHPTRSERRGAATRYVITSLAAKIEEHENKS